MMYEERRRGIVWSVVAMAAALALAMGLLPFAPAFAGDSENADEELVVTSEPTLDEGDEPDEGDGEAVALVAQEADSTKDVYIDNTVDNSRSYVTGAVEVTDLSTNEKTTVVVYSNSASVTYSNPRTSNVNALVEEAVQAVIKYAKDNGYAYDDTEPIEPVETTGKVWDNRKYTTVEDGDAVLLGDTDYLTGAYGVSSNNGDTRTHIASGDYGKETHYSITLKATAETVADAAYNNITGDGGSWTKGGGETLGFTFKRDKSDDLTFMNFEGIKVDGRDVAASNYTAKAGSVILALSASYLETLSAGSHELTAVFSDGVGTASFEVKDAASEPEQAESASEEPASEVAATKASADGSSSASSTLPKTADALPVALFGGIALMSALVLAMAWRLRKN